MIVPALFALALAVQSPAADSLYQLALRLPESRLTVEARARSLAVREAIADAMTRVVREPGQATEKKPEHGGRPPRKKTSADRQSRGETA